MKLSYLNLLPFFAPESDKGGGATDEGDSLSRDLAELGDGEENKDEGKGDGEEEEGGEGEEEEGQEEGGEEDSKGEEDGQEEEGGEEEDEGKKAPQKAEGDRPTVKAIKEKYPNIFKDFPGLKSAFFLAPQFLEVFPDPETAKEAAAKAAEFDQLEGSLVQGGDSKLLLTTLSENNPKAFKSVVENFASTVRDIDGDAYVKLSTPIIEELLYYAEAHGKKTDNKNLQLAAKHLANYVFANGGEIPDITKREGKKEPHPAEKALEEERATYAREKFQGAAVKLADEIDPEINKVVELKLENFTSFERRAIVKEVRTELDETLKADKAFQSQLKGLWKRASDAGYTRETLSRVKAAWLERAKVLVPGIRNRLRQEALDARKAGGGNSSEAGKKRTFPGQGGSGQKSSVKGVTDPKKVDWRKTTDMDILNS